MKSGVLLYIAQKTATPIAVPGISSFRNIPHRITHSNLTIFCTTSVTLVGLSYLYKIRSLIPRTFSFLEMLLSTDVTMAFFTTSFLLSRIEFTCKVGLHLAEKTSSKNGHDCKVKDKMFCFRTFEWTVFGWNYK